ncbi:TSUP family transporter [Martelella mediterranea]|uniref:TSUP family transporter n=1 Tax=Martelella mediterranea TaxID=293089 RepID=UPI001E4FAEDD|nr:TSUP family transporter [Martelella mediterranea]MCD1636683.1 TSUP family transporter [Martelella mediterranea]
MFEASIELLLILFAAAYVAGFVDSIAGGGGLITIPVLLISGVPPLQALGTNKLQGMFGAASATISYARAGRVEPMKQWPMALIAIAGGALGALVATLISGDALRAALPFLLVAIGLYFALRSGLDDSDREKRLSAPLFAALVVPVIGFYDGLFGPGTGSFFMIAFVTLGGFGMLKATAHTKFLNLSTNIGAFAVFMFGGAILWKVGLVMGLGQFLGARTGSNLAMKNGAKIIRPLLVLSCMAMAVKVFLDEKNQTYQWLMMQI